MKSNYEMGLCFEGFAELWKGFSKNFSQTKPENINERRYKNSDGSTSSLLNTAERSVTFTASLFVVLQHEP